MYSIAAMPVAWSGIIHLAFFSLRLRLFQGAIWNVLSPDMAYITC